MDRCKFEPVSPAENLAKYFDGSMSGLNCWMRGRKMSGKSGHVTMRDAIFQDQFVSNAWSGRPMTRGSKYLEKRLPVSVGRGFVRPSTEANSSVAVHKASFKSANTPAHSFPPSPSTLSPFHHAMHSLLLNIIHTLMRSDHSLIIYHTNAAIARCLRHCTKLPHEFGAT